MVATGKAELPVGVVTLVFSDIEGSTRLIRASGEAYASLLGEHDWLLREAWGAHGGVVVHAEGDAFCVAFTDPARALEAVVAAQRALAERQWPPGCEVRVRMGVHSGSPRVRDGDYWGIDVNYAARLCAAAAGGQVLVSQSTAGLVDVVLVDLGQHAVKDFPSARRIFHLPIDGRGKEQFPQPRTLRAGQTNLPDQLSSFIGREAELTQLRLLVASARLVTLTGTGGVGKTRLALRLGAELLDGSGDGVWFVDLAPLSSAGLVASRAAQALGVQVSPDRVVLDALADSLSDRNLLVVLDNCEHVVEEAASLVAELLRCCPGVFVMATSREPLRIAGEQVYRVPSLSIPAEDADVPRALADSEAVRLFVERAAEQRAGFALTSENALAVGQVCRRLDGIPLAIELAAVRLRSMSVADLNARLDHRLALLKGGARTALPRQQTLHALIDWSFKLLAEPERIFLARLSVFAAGGFDLDAAEAVCRGEGVSDREALDHLDALVDKSLVQADDAMGSVRYRLLETVREYASARLSDRGQGEVDVASLAHRDHYLALAETARPGLQGPDRRIWLDVLSLEHDNLRAALSESERDPDPRPGLRLAAALNRFWLARGHVVEGAGILARVLERPGADEPTAQRADALAGYSHVLAHWLGEYDAALASAEEALELARGHQDDCLTAEALDCLGWAHMYKGEFSRPLELSDEALAIARTLGDDYFLSKGYTTRAAAVGSLGGDARHDFEQALHFARTAGSINLTAIGLGNLGYLEVVAGDPFAGRAHLEEALAIHRELGEPTDVWVSSNLGLARYLAGEPTTAAHLIRDVITAADRDRDPRTLATGLLLIGLTAEQAEVAAQLYGASDAMMEAIGYAIDRYLSQHRDADWRRRIAVLGETAFLDAYRAGRQLPRERAISLGLQAVPTPDRRSTDTQ